MTYTLHEDLEYLPGGGVAGEFLADVVVPEGPAPGEGWPSVVYWHAGGFDSGDKALPLGIEPWAGLLESGVALVSANYPLGAMGEFPAAENAGVALLAWLRGGAGDRLGLDTGKMVLAGHSAGGQMASWCAWKPAAGAAEGVVGVALVGVPTDWGAFAPSVGGGAAEHFGEATMASVPQAKKNAASPAVYVGLWDAAAAAALGDAKVRLMFLGPAGTPPFGGAAGGNHDTWFGEQMEAKLAGQGVDVVLDVGPAGGTHDWAAMVAWVAGVVGAP